MSKALIEHLRTQLGEKRIQDLAGTTPLEKILNDGKFSLQRVFTNAYKPSDDAKQDLNPSSELVQDLTALDLSQPSSIKNANAIIEKSFSVVSDTPEWKALLLAIHKDKREAFTQMVRTAFLFSSFGDLFIKQKSEGVTQAQCKFILEVNRNNDERKKINKVLEDLPNERSVEEVLIHPLIAKSPSEAKKEIKHQRDAIVASLNEHLNPSEKIQKICQLILNDIFRLQARKEELSSPKDIRQREAKIIELEALLSSIMILRPEEEKPLSEFENNIKKMINLQLKKLSSETKENLAQCLQAYEPANKEKSKGMMVAAFTRMFKGFAIKPTPEADVNPEANKENEWENIKTRNRSGSSRS